MSLYISRVRVRNIRCFQHIELNLQNFNLDSSSTENSFPWTMIVGDNATGKTTFLRCIAMGLCDEASAAGLLKESDEGMIRRDYRDGIIEIELFDPAIVGEIYTIKTKIEQFTDGSTKFERVRQETYPDHDFPWDRIFVCAYGAGRGTSGTGDVAGYSPINATYNLFNYGEGLQNAELTIRRLTDQQEKNNSYDALRDILDSGGEDVSSIALGDTGLAITGRWGKSMPLRDLADGFKSTFLWVSDFIGWSIDKRKSGSALFDVSGVVLVDELEQHLHPSWQQKIVSQLRKTFPHIQFITSTHSPLVASSISDKEDDSLWVLELNENGSIGERRVSTVEYYTVNETLTSEVFRLETPRPYSQGAEILEQFKALLGKERSEQEESEYSFIKDELIRLYPNLSEMVRLNELEKKSEKIIEKSQKG